MVTVTKCPPGQAQGADDLPAWGTNRRAGRSGASLNKPKRRRRHPTAFASVLAEQNRIADQAEAERQRVIEYLNKRS